jgi:hypothetical protein
MSSLKGRIEVASPEVITRLESSESLISVTESTDLGAFDLVAESARIGLGCDQSGDSHSHHPQ